jgi:hypothetical protein
MAANNESGEEKRFMRMSAADIRSGTGDTNPGWVMGSFVGAGDLRHCEDFEIKEWDIRTMRTDWRSGDDCGTEYIAVLEGVLNVILGRLGADGATVEEDTTVEVRAEERILLARGVWRKLRAGQNIKGLTVRNCKRGQR